MLSLRGALQIVSTNTAAEKTNRPTKVQTFNDTLELDGPLVRKFYPLCTALRGRNSQSLRWSSAYLISCRCSGKEYIGSGTRQVALELRRQRVTPSACPGSSLIHRQRCRSS